MTEHYLRLREKYPRFAYRGYNIEEDDRRLKITYYFETEGLSAFAPTWVFPKAEGEGRSWTDDKLMRDMIFSLGMVELISYWKIACPPTVLVEAGTLSREQIAWWKDLYFNGLGEFFYVNKIDAADPEHFMNLVCADGAYEEKEADIYGVLAGSAMEADSGVLAGRDMEADSGVLAGSGVEADSGVLVPIGGGKDSAVTLELMRKAGKDVYAYIINPRGATIHTTEVAGMDSSHVISATRTLDPNMLELNRQGYLNGHTPFSALVAFSGIIAARMYGLPMIALSNESSANESTVQGSTVNHQYSKSFKFEEDFQRYRSRYLSGSAYYFSMLRPLSEFQIAGYFAGLKQYHGIFRSCNAGSKTDSWCGHCPKCLFVYLILSPFLPAREVRDIFGRNMLEDDAMRDTLDQLVGIQEEKPFECVGSRDEINTAIVLTVGHMEEKGEPLPLLLSYYKTTDLYQIYKARGDLYSSYYDENNLIPPELAGMVKSSCVIRSLF